MAIPTADRERRPDARPLAEGSGWGSAEPTVGVGNRGHSAARSGVSVCPIILIFAATAAGILLDRMFDPLETRNWLTCGLVFVTAAGVLLGSAAISTTAILGAVVAFAGAWHHFLWKDRSPTDLAAIAPDHPTPAWVRGVVTEVAGLRESEGYAPGDSARLTTRLTLDLEEASDGARWRPATGRVATIVAGDRTDLRPGVPVEVAGQLSRISGPLNPGEFDYRDFLRARGILLRLTVDAPGGISIDPSRPVWPATFWLGKMRDACRGRLLDQLDSRTASLASALILGRREDIDPEVNDAFARTGTTHLLAISGLQLQALAFALGLFFRCLGVPRKLAYGGVGLITIGYAMLVGLEPSVVRSAVMTLTFCLAAVAARPTRPANTLALAGLVTLCWNPFFLFDVGCQLSFLAIAALIWLVPLGRQGLAEVHRAASGLISGPPSPVDELERHFEPFWRSALRRALRWTGLCVLSSLVVWLAALPLVALRFHLVSPIGILLNIPLIPLTTIALMLGAAGMTIGFLWGPLAGPLVLAADLLLRATDAIVRWGVAQPWGHRFVAGPLEGAVALFYVLLVVATVLTLASRADAQTGFGSWIRTLAPWIIVAASTAPGWWISWPREVPHTLEGEVLAVAHGLAVWLRLPDGHTMLYDCGKMGDPGVGRRIIAPALWSRGLNRIDEVYLSHADQDHYNGLADLLDRFRIGAVVLPPGFATVENPNAEGLLRKIQERRVPIRIIAAPARWTRGETEFRILHPPEGWHPESPDNARSLVLDIAHGGRHFLLTGDLDQVGLVAVVEQPHPEAVDLMLAPHHGGKTANPPWLYSWAKPRAVVVSQRSQGSGTNDGLSQLGRKDIPLLRTWQCGAVHFQWKPDRIITRGWLDTGEQARFRSATPGGMN